MWRLTLNPTTSSKEPPLIKRGWRHLRSMIDKLPIHKKTYSPKQTQKLTERENYTFSTFRLYVPMRVRESTLCQNQLIISNNKVFVIFMGVTQKNTAKTSFPQWFSSSDPSSFSSQLLACTTSGDWPLPGMNDIENSKGSGCLPSLLRGESHCTGWTSFEPGEGLSHLTFLIRKPCWLHVCYVCVRDQKHFKEGPTERMGTRLLARLNA